MVFAARPRRLLLSAMLAVSGACAFASASPAGELALSANRCDQGACQESIWRAGDDGALQQRLTFEGGRDMSPSWSPDGRSVAFSRFGAEDGRWGLYVVDAAGGEPRQITWGVDWWPDWSPRGDAIAFEGIRGDEAGGLPDSPSSQPFGINDSDIFLVDPDGSDLRRVVNGSGDEMHPRFTQDGSRVVFLRLGTGPGGLVGEGDDSGWYSVELDGSDERRLTVGLPPMPEYSPDGRLLAFVTNWNELYTMRADGTDIRRWPGQTVFQWYVAWSPIGPTLYYPSFGPDRTATVNRIDFSAAQPRPVPLIEGMDVDWTDGTGGGSAPDGLAPATVLLGPKQRPIAQTSGAAYASARRYRPRRSRPPSVAKRELHFYAVDRTGIRRVDAAIARVVRRGRCRFLGRRRLGRVRSCSKPIFRQVRSDPEWRSRIARLGKGLHLLGFRAVDVHGNGVRRPRLSPVRLR